jgi:hypothetical protein
MNGSKGLAAFLTDGAVCHGLLYFKLLCDLSKAFTETDTNFEQTL